MKKILLLFIFILLFGCQVIQNNDNKITKIDCPRVFFSSENNVFVSGYMDNLDMDNIDYKATLNNYGFTGSCFEDFEYKNYFLDLLIIVEAINPKDTNIDLPIFAILYDNKEQIVDKQFFRVKDNLTFNQETSKYEISEVLGKLNIFIEKNRDINFISIGFVKIN